MSISLAIDGHTWPGVNALCVCRGAAGGALAYVPDGAAVEEVARHAAHIRGKYLFVCDGMTRAHRPLLPFAAAFVFGLGTPLSHFAAQLRSAGIPACIDRALWEAGRTACLAGGAVARLDCGPITARSADEDRLLAAGAEKVRTTLSRQPLRLPVFDAATGAAIQAARAGEIAIGDKALAVNALVVGGLPTPAGLVLVLAGNRMHESLDGIIDRAFPSFGAAGCAAVMARPSFPSGGPIGADSPKSRAVTTHQELAAAIDTIAATAPSAAVLLQERVESYVRGTLYTGRPWDDTTTDVVAALTFPGDDAPDRSPRHVELDPSGELAAQLVAQLPAGCPAKPFALFVGEALALRDLYGAPLDIEFVVAPNLQFQYVQFRPLYRD